MARRNDHSRDEIKNMAIKAGRELIDDEGYAGFSTRKVAAKIGYTVGTIYNVFQNHDELILHVNGTTLDDLAEYLEARRDKSRHGIESVVDLAHLYIDFATDHTARWSVLFEHKMLDDDDLPAWFQDKIRALFSRVEETLSSFAELREDEARKSAKVLWAGIQGICSLGMDGKLDAINSHPMKELASELIRNYVHGLGSR